MFRLTALGALLFPMIVGCEQQAADPAPAAADPCPDISLEKMAGQWIKVAGNKGDHKTRVAIRNEGGAWSATYINGGWTKMAMSGEMRGQDLQLTQVATGTKKAQFEAGTDSLTRLYFEPNKKKCSMRVVTAKVSMDGDKEKEQQQGVGFTEFLRFPNDQGFTFEQCTEQAYIAKAATDWKVAQKEAANGLNPVGALGDAVTVTAWSKAAEDGAADCTYDMDVYFDDLPAKTKAEVEAGATVGAAHQKISASAVEGDMRPWRHDYFAPYSGNHHFEIYRYKSCGGGERELLGVACLEGILD